MDIGVNKGMFMMFCLCILIMGFCGEALRRSAENFFEIHDLSAIGSDNIGAKIERM